jgi:hypothetical protein
VNEIEIGRADQEGRFSTRYIRLCCCINTDTSRPTRPNKVQWWATTYGCAVPCIAKLSWYGSCFHLPSTPPGQASQASADVLPYRSPTVWTIGADITRLTTRLATGDLRS